MMVFAYFAIKYYQKPEKITDEELSKVMESEYISLLMTVGNLIYFSVLVAILVSLLNYKLYLKKSWDFISVITGIYLCKAAMLVTVIGGPLLYSCLLA